MEQTRCPEVGGHSISTRSGFLIWKVFPPNSACRTSTDTFLSCSRQNSLRGLLPESASKFHTGPGTSPSKKPMCLRDFILYLITGRLKMYHLSRSCLLKALNRLTDQPAIIRQSPRQNTCLQKMNGSSRSTATVLCK